MAVHYEALHWLNYNSYEDLRFYEIGHQKCEPDYGYGPIIRDKYILHYIINGKGHLEIDGHMYPIRAKQAFIIPPGILGYYQADSKQPWEYIWIIFHGSKATEILKKAGLTRRSPVFTAKEDCSTLENNLFEILQNPFEEYFAVGKLFEFYQQLINLSSHPANKEQQADTASLYVHMVTQYITEKYSEPIRIQEIANHCGLDRSYLSKLFKNATGLTPQKYLIQFRINRAKELLKNPNMPIQHVGYSVGYHDPLSFSKIFKQEVGLWPSEYRHQIINDQLALI